MVDYIRSKSVKEYLKQEAVELSDLQKAVLILRTDYPMEMVHASLCELAENTKDGQLKEAIREKVEKQRQEVFAVQKSQDHVVYALEVYEPDEEKYVNEGYYNSYHAADQHARYFSMEYIIRKYRLFGDDGIENHFHSVFGYILSEIGALLLDMDGKVLKYFSSICIPEASQKDGILDSQCQPLKHPFRKGDLVENLITGDTGVVNDCGRTLDGWTSQKESAAQCEGQKETGILVEYADPVGNFYQLHSFPYDLEYAKAPKTGYACAIRWEVLKEAQKLVKGEGKLERFTSCKARIEAKKRYW